MRTRTFIAAVAMSSVLSCVARAPAKEALAVYAEAKAAYAQGRLSDAERMLVPIANGTSLPQARFLLGKVRFFLGKYDEAAHGFLALRSAIPKYHEADLWLARTYLQSGRSDEAEAVAKTLLAYDSSDSRLYYLEAMIRSGRGDTKDALGFLERSCESGEELAKSYFESARLYYRFGQDERALERLGRAAAVLPSESALRGAVAELQKKLGIGRTK